jgi:hypothetical protein
LRYWPTRGLQLPSLRRRPGGTRLIRSERLRNPDRTWLSRSTRIRIAERPRTTLSRRKRRTLPRRSRDRTRAGPGRASLRRRTGPNALARRRTPLLGSRKPRLRNRISPLTPRSLLGRHPLRNRERSLRRLRRFRNLTHRTAKAWRFGPRPLVHRVSPGKDRSRVGAPLAGLTGFRLPL